MALPIYNDPNHPPIFNDGKIKFWNGNGYDELNISASVLDSLGNFYANVVGRTDTMQNLSTVLGTAGELATASDEGALIRLSGTAGVYDLFESSKQRRLREKTVTALRATLVPEVNFSTTFGVGWCEQMIGKCFFISKQLAATNTWQYSEDGKHWRNADPMTTAVYAATTNWVYHTDGSYVFANPCQSVAGSSFYEVAAPYGAAQQTAITLPASQLWKLQALRPVNQSIRCVIAMPTAAAATTAAIINNGIATTITLPVSAAAWVGSSNVGGSQAYTDGCQPLAVYSDGLQVIYAQPNAVAFTSLPNLPSTLTGFKVFVLKDYILIYSPSLTKYYVAKIQSVYTNGQPSGFTIGSWVDMTAPILAGLALIGATQPSPIYTYANSRYFMTTIGSMLIYTSDFINWTATPVAAVGGVSNLLAIENGALVKLATDANPYRIYNFDTGSITVISDLDGATVSVAANSFRASGNVLLAATSTTGLVACDMTGAIIAKPAQFNTSTAATGPLSIPKNTETFSYNPATTTAAITITLPPTPFNGQEVTIIGGGTLTTGTVVTTLTLGVDTSIAGTTIIGAAATTLVVGTPLKYKYDLRINAWYRVQ